MIEPAKAVFLSYASQDAEAAQRICDALRAAGIEVWFDQSELRGGDAWDRQIKKQIHDCALFVPVISAHSQARLEGYFRREWKLAADRTHDMAEEKAFLVPVVIDDTSERYASVPDKFRDVQWTHLVAGETPPAFAERILRLLSPEVAHAPAELKLPTPAVPPTTTASPRLAQRPAKRWPVWLLTALGIAVIGLSYFAVNQFVLSKRPAADIRTSASTGQAGSPAQSAIPEKSIAVLPFADLSEKHDQEYFADGMAEEILDILGKIPQLTVIGRTSSFQFKGRTEDLRTIGQRLGAAYVVEGSVRKAGDRIRVTAQLIDARSGAHLWSDSYDRDFGDVLILQDEIATSIARAMQLTIGARSARPLRDERAIEAYTFYLRGKVALDKFSTASLLEAQNAFEQALTLDPTLLPAAEGLALTYLNRGFDANDIAGREAWDYTRSAAQKALQIDANSATAHGVLGYIAAVRDYDWSTSEREFHTAFALNPNDPDTLANAGTISGMRGDYQEGLRRLKASLVLDPLNASTYVALGTVLYVSRDYSGAETAMKKSLTIYPDVDSSHWILGLIQLLRGQRDSALREFEADPEVGNRDVGIALVNHALGNKAASDAALARTVKGFSTLWPYGIALVHAYRGERDQAFDWLEKAYTLRDQDLANAFGDPYLAALHDDPRWSALMKKMNLSN